MVKLTYGETELILKDDLPYAFKEFEPYLGQCKFTTCLHVKDKGCRVIEAVENGEIERTRHDSYIEIFNELKDLKPWNTTKKTK